MMVYTLMNKLPPTPRIANRIYYEITSTCNLRCIHCNDIFRTQSRHLDSRQVITFHNALVKFGIHNSVVTGGEPTIHKDFENIIRGLSKYGSVLVTTNGTVLPPKRQAEILGRYPNVTFQISMDGITQQTFDRVRGEGTYDKVMALINPLIEQGLEKQIGLSMTVMRHNMHEVQPMVDFAKSNRLASLHFPTLLPVGYAKENWSTIAPSPEQQIELEEMLLDIMVDETNGTSISVNRIGQVLTRALYGTKGDCLVNFTLKIDPDGNVLPCPTTANRNLSVGSICESGFPEALMNRLEKRWAEYLSLAGSELPGCANCHAKDHCSGRFCENCGLLSPLDDGHVADHACQIVSHHFKKALDEIQRET